MVADSQQNLIQHSTSNTLSLTFDIVSITSLTDGEREARWDVYCRHFEAGRDKFDASLARADQVIRNKERRTGRQNGLVVVALRPTELEGRRFYWLWAGTLTIDRECPGKWLLEHSRLYFLTRFRLQHPRACQLVGANS